MGGKIQFKSLSEMPPMALSLADMSFNRTGSWRYLRPVRRERPAPCRVACPAGTKIPRALQHVARGEFAAAIGLIRESNPLPGICGRVCHHPCESACNRKELDEAISIRALERFVSDVCSEEADHPPPVCRIEKIAIVGSGPAGLSCAYFLAKAGLRVKIYEAAEQPGGMLRVGIPAYRLPREVLDREIRNVTRLGVEIETSCRIGKDLELRHLENRFDAVFVATGTQASRSLGIAGEDLPEVSSGLDFLKTYHAGRRPSIGRKVVLIGGGNTAIDAARVALRLGSEPVVVYRRTCAEMPAIEEEIEAAQREGIEFVFLAAPVSLEKDGKGLKIGCIRMKLGEPDESGRASPLPIAGSEFTLRADTLLTAIGEQAETTFGFRVAPRSLGCDQGTVLRRDRLFLGGDVAAGPSSVVEAIASGREAAAAVMRALGLEPSFDERPIWTGEAAPYKDINPDYFPQASRISPAERRVEERIRDFSEVVAELSLEQARNESGRCFACGICNGCDNCWVFCPDAAVSRDDGDYGIDLDICKGCGVCAEECPRGVISLLEERR